MNEDYIFRVTNTSSDVEITDNWDFIPKEGSLAWAIDRVNSYYGEETPVILFTKAVSGKTIKLGTENKGEDYLSTAWLDRDVIFRMEDGASPVTLNSVTDDPDEPYTIFHQFRGLTIEDGIKCNASIGVEDGTLEIHNTSFGGTVAFREGARLVGEGITFTSKTPFSFSIGEGWPGTEWDGTKASLQARVDEALGGAGYTLSNKAASLELTVYTGFNKDMVINNEWQKSILPDGFSNLELGLSVDNGRTVTIAAGTKLSLSFNSFGLQVLNGTLNIEPGAVIKDSYGWGLLANVGDKGVLNVDGADLSDSTLFLGEGGKAHITNCKANYADITLGGGEVTMTNCDLSKARFDVTQLCNPDYWGITDAAVINLSGNSWGTTNLKSIMKKFYVTDYDTYEERPADASLFYSDSNPDGIIKLGSFAAAPETKPAKAPTLSLKKPSIISAENGAGVVEFKWKGPKDPTCTYQLIINGVEVSLADPTATTAIVNNVADGTDVPYTVIATNGSGMSTTKSGTFSFDATAPVLSVGDSLYTVGDHSKGKAQVIFDWDCNEEKVTYQVFIDGNEKASYKGSKTTCKLKLTEGDHSYSIIAKDKSGNVSEALSGSFYIEKGDLIPPAAPELKDVSAKKKGEGASNITVKWNAPAGEKKLTYAISAVGDNGYITEEVITKSKSYTFKGLTDGKYTVSVYAIDDSQNRSLQALVIDNITADSVAPTLEGFEAPENKSLTTNPAPTISWKYVEGETYTLKVGKVTVDSSTLEVVDGMCRYTVQGGDGKYKYTLTAVDQCKNKTKKTGSFTVDSTPVTLSKAKVSKAKLVEGGLQFTLSWKGESKASYNVLIDGQDATEGGTTKANSKLTLADGEHLCEISATDKAGNVSAPLTLVLNVNSAEKAVTLTETAVRQARTVAGGLDHELGLSAGSVALPGTDALAGSNAAAAPLWQEPGTEAEKRLGMLA